MPQAPVKRDNECLTNEKSQESGWYRDYESSLEQGRFCFISQCQAAEQIDKLACKIAQTFGTTATSSTSTQCDSAQMMLGDCGKLRKQREQSGLIKQRRCQCQAAEQIDKLACKIAQTFGTTSNIEHEHAVRQCADDAWDCGKLRKQREQSRLIKPNQA